MLWLSPAKPLAICVQIDNPVSPVPHARVEYCLVQVCFSALLEAISKENINNDVENTIALVGRYLRKESTVPSQACTSATIPVLHVWARALEHHSGILPEESDNCASRYEPSTHLTMRSIISRTLTALALISSALAQDSQHKLSTVDDVLSETKGRPKDAGAAAGATNSEAISDESTTFNGIKVLPMKELNGDGFDKDTKDGYWLAL